MGILIKEQVMCSHVMHLKQGEVRISKP